MAFTVIKSSEYLVRPAEPTPGGKLDLSAIDKLPGLRSKVRTYHVFCPGLEPAKVITQALSKALVHYYPLAGRLIGSENGDIQIACTGDGVWFAEATANCSLQSVNYLSHPLVQSHEQLLPDPRPDLDPTDIIVLIQVTQFSCGGFVMGLEFCHTVCDGLGAAQFLISVGEFARGLARPTVSPVWLREAIPAPPKPKFEFDHQAVRPPLPVRSYQLEQIIIDVSPDQIGSLKNQFFGLTGQRCSTFEALAATVWQIRTRAVNPDPTVDFKLVFFANARPLVKPTLPDGFYGNCFFPVAATATGGRLVTASMVEVINMIKEAKKKLSAEFSRWAAGEGDDPYVPTLSYNTLFVSEWSRLGFDRVDYGWGKPVQMVPLTYADVIPVCILGSPPATKMGVRLITQCVEEAHEGAFHEQMFQL